MGSFEDFISESDSKVKISGNEEGILSQLPFGFASHRDIPMSRNYSDQWNVALGDSIFKKLKQKYDFVGPVFNITKIKYGDKNIQFYDNLAFWHSWGDDVSKTWKYTKGETKIKVEKLYIAIGVDATLYCVININDTDYEILHTKIKHVDFKGLEVAIKKLFDDYVNNAILDDATLDKISNAQNSDGNYDEIVKISSSGEKEIQKLLVQLLDDAWKSKNIYFTNKKGKLPFNLAIRCKYASLPVDNIMTKVCDFSKFTGALVYVNRDKEVEVQKIHNSITVGKIEFDVDTKKFFKIYMKEAVKDKENVEELKRYKDDGLRLTTSTNNAIAGLEYPITMCVKISMAKLANFNAKTPEVKKFINYWLNRGNKFWTIVLELDDINGSIDPKIKNEIRNSSIFIGNIGDKTTTYDCKYKTIKCNFVKYNYNNFNYDTTYILQYIV